MGLHSCAFREIKSTISPLFCLTPQPQQMTLCSEPIWVQLYSSVRLDYSQICLETTYFVSVKNGRLSGGD